MNRVNIKKATGIIAATLLILPSAFASNLMPLPEINTLAVKNDASGYTASGDYRFYTSVGSGLSLSASKSKASLVRLMVEEQEDWRGNLAILPALRAYLQSNPELVKGLEPSARFNERFQHPHLFGKIIPASESYSLVFDLSAEASRVQLAKLLRNIAPGVMLSECALDNVLANLKLQ